MITKDIEKLQIFIPLLEKKITFVTKVAQPCGQYRINIPKELIRNKYLDPTKEIIYWIYFIEEI